MNQKRFYISLFASALAINAAAQENLGGSNGLIVSGSIQSDILIPETDKKIHTEDTNDWGLTNTYAEINAMSNYVDAGVRFEYLQPGRARRKVVTRSSVASGFIRVCVA